MPTDGASKLASVNPDSGVVEKASKRIGELELSAQSSPVRPAPAIAEALVSVTSMQYCCVLDQVPDGV